MTHWFAIRKRAQQEYISINATFGAEGVTRAQLVDAAIEASEIKKCVGLPKGSPLLMNSEARLDFENKAIWYRDDVELWKQTFYKAHELAHFWLHQHSFECSDTDLNPGATEEDVIERVKSYSPLERMEREANVCAREFLMPAFWIKELYVEKGKGISEIAGETGLPEGMVQHQMSRALLMIEGGEIKEVKKLHGLDPSQQEAAFIPEGPVLVEAGPGTGKTSTLIGRLEWLLTKGVSGKNDVSSPIPPHNVLALTFSNKAAEEMRERLSRVCPKEALGVWMGTFHAFGRELLLKYGAWPEAGIVDPVRGLSILERLLPDLELNHFLNLSKPVAPLKEIQDAISRAKDELCSPARFRKLAIAMHNKALLNLENVDGARELKEAEKYLLKAEKAVEAAGVYEKYQSYLDVNKLYDFGDLIYKSTLLLQENVTILRQVQREYSHILVDEVQDVNHASGVFLELVAGKGLGLWMVGDVRQAIYRFRGATTASILQFHKDPKIKQRSLKWNYRSQQPIIDAFALLSSKMVVSKSFAGFNKWKSARPSKGGKVRMEIAGSREAEGDGIADLINKQREAFSTTGGKEGLLYKDQAILCRTNNQLAKIAEMLLPAGIPTLFLGNFFEREEVADMLSVLELTCEHSGRGLYRVARFPEYNIPLSDIRELKGIAGERNVRFPKALSLAEEVKSISTEGKRKLALLWNHVKDFHPGISPWSCLSQYLFEKSNYLRSQLTDDSIIAQQARVALFQLLEFTYNYSLDKNTTKRNLNREFLQHVRLMIIRNDDRVLWKMPEWAGGIDAVRLLTIHASKGLEFEAVYVPLLGKGLFPLRWSGDSRPIPDGILSTDPKEDHTEEEECLFFVACSRARNLLCLSKAAVGYGYRRGKPSRSTPPDMLLSIEDVLPHSPNGSITWPGEPEHKELLSDVPILDQQPEYAARELDDYLFCSKKYYYEHLLSVSRASEKTPYLQVHRCVKHVMNILFKERKEGDEISEDKAKDYLADIWEKKGLNEVHHAERYWNEAVHMVENVVQELASATISDDMPEWVVQRTHAAIKITPDHIEVVNDGNGSIASIQRWKTGRIGSKEKDKPYYSLLAEGARTAFPDEQIQVEVHSLSRAHKEVIPTPNSHVSKYDAAIKGIQSGQFPPKNDSRECPYCPYYFICPAGE